MVRTTVYLPVELKEQLQRAARRSGRSEAELIREGVRLAVAAEEPPSPKIPLFESGQPDLARRVDELLAGFGDR